MPLFLIHWGKKKKNFNDHITADFIIVNYSVKYWGTKLHLWLQLRLECLLELKYCSERISPAGEDDHIWKPREDPVCLEDSTDWWLFIFIPVYTRVKKVRTTSVLNTSDKMKIIPFSVQKKTWFRPQQCDCRSCSGDRVYGDERHLFYMRGFKIIMVLKNILFWTRTAAALTWIENGKTEIK